ncbi:type II secretion system F family protein [Marinobacter daepoensis]|uniref:Type II secretion system F family protein n=1 Tax=Marinobacter daepoensis TaxID=262077 RepID=A0ABS3BHF8_9GAMM|nr:type II secretion system F family protein [Marinobacter daepoensis]MBY6079121.1 type II secretion system F family protein [Marinobacter daepoensis]
MDNFWFAAALICALVSLVSVYAWSPARALKARATSRLQHHQMVNDENAEGAILNEFVFALVEKKFLAGDFKELEEALDATGKTPLRARQVYLVFCWLLPMVAAVLLAVFADVLIAMIGFMLCFYLPRRSIRSAGKTAEKQQNREAIELCHLTRMMMEAGLTPERALKLIALQGRELMPLLIKRIERFNRVMESGADRSHALEDMGRNKNLNVLRSYVTIMKQAGSLGSAVSGGLEQIIADAHHDERSKLKEETNRIGARMTIIMMVFMLPALFILIGGPAVLSIMDALQR